MSAEDWEEVDTVHDSDGVVAVITKRKVGMARYAIGLFKEFVPSGKAAHEAKRTMWIDPERIEAAIRVLKLAGEKIHDISMRELAHATKPTFPGGNGATNGNGKKRVKVG